MKSLKELLEEQLEQDIDGQSCNVVILDENDRVLLLKRSHDDDLFPGTWCTPGGHRQSDESPSESASRECEEECGIQAKPIYALTHTFPGGHKTNFYFAKYPNNFHSKDIHISDEHVAYRWFHIEELDSINLSGSLIDPLTKVLRMNGIIV